MEQNYPNLLIESKELITFYLYHGLVPFLPSLALHLLPLANRLQMDNLKQLCEDVIMFFLVLILYFAQKLKILISQIGSNCL